MNPIEIRVSGVRLNDVAGGIVSSSIDIWNTPNRQVISQQLALQDGAINTFSKLQPKIITLTGWIRQDSRQAFERKLDEVKRASFNNENTLEVTFEDGVRTWNATLQESAFDRQYLPDYCDFMLRFWAGDPVGRGAEETLTEAVLTTSSMNNVAVRTFYNNDFQGTSTAPVLPVLTFTIDSWTQTEDPNTTATYLDISNPDSQGGIRLNFSPNREKYIAERDTGTFEINFETRVVSKAGTPLAVSGSWFEWTPTLTDMKVAFSSNPQAVFSLTLNGSFTHRYI